MAWERSPQTAEGCTTVFEGLGKNLRQKNPIWGQVKIQLCLKTV